MLSLTGALHSSREIFLRFLKRQLDTVRIKVQVGKSKKRDLRQWTIKGASFHRRVAGRGRYTKALSFQVTTGFIEVMENLESRGI